MNAKQPPLTLPVDLAGELVGASRQVGYRMVKAGTLPVLPGPGRKKVPTAAVERLVGRTITMQDIEAAKARLEPKREAFLTYQADYRRSKLAMVGA